MNTAAGPTLEINNTSNVSIPDYPAQASRSSEFTRSNSGHRRLTLREKVAKQRSERENEAAQPRLMKATSLSATSNNQKPTTPSTPNAAITEERTVFGFKIMKGLQGSSDTNNPGSFTRGTSLRQPVKTTHNSTNRFRDKSGDTIFYTLKANRVSDSAKTADIEFKGRVKDQERSLSKDPKLDTTTDQRHVSDKLSVRQLERESFDKKVNEGVNTGETVDERTSDRKKFRTKDTKTRNNDDSEVLIKETKTENNNAEKLLIRAESLREGKSRLEEFREKQRKEKLTRSLTNPDFEQDTSTSNGKNISESLEEIRARIRERRRKKEEFKKSRSLPELNSPPKQEYDGNIKERVDAEHQELADLRKNEKSIKTSSDLTANSEMKGDEQRECLRLSESEYLEIEENSKMNTRKTDIKCEDMIAKDSRTDKVIHRERMEKKEKINDSRNDEVVVKNTRERDEMMNKEEHKEEGNVSEDMKTKDKEIENNKEDSQKASTEVTLTTISASEESTGEAKKPTKRERRRQERYQRSKTMSAIMYNEISLDARRETKHKGETKDGGSLAIPSVSEIKKRFVEAEGTKMSEPGLFYSGKLSGKSSSQSKTRDKSKNESSEKSKKTNLSRRHTLASGTTFDNKVAQEEIKSSDGSAVSKSLETPTKTPLRRSYTLPSYTNKDKQCGDSSESQAKKVSENGRRLPVRRHTIGSQTSWTISRHNPVKLSESVEALREKFSKGEAPVFNLATSSSKTDDNVEKMRRRVRSESGVEFNESRNTKEVNKEHVSGSSLSRRHTVANQPQNSEKEKLERQKDKFLAKNNEKFDDIRENVESKAKEQRRPKKEKKEDKTSVLKLKKLFLGQAAPTDKKTKLREQRAKTIAGGIGPEILKEFDKNKDNVISNNYVVKPDFYVNDMSQNEVKDDGVEQKRRSSDLNPESYLSPTEELGNDFVFEETVSQDHAQLKQTSSDAIETSVELKKANCVFEQKEISNDLETDSSVLDPAQRRCGSESDMSKVTAIKDQNLDDYLTTIKTMVESPKSKRASPRASPQKEKFISTQSFEKDEGESKQQLNVVKSNLLIHSWSTSDLDKIIHGSRSSPTGSQVELSSEDLDAISSSTTRLQSLTEGRTKVRPKRMSSKSLNPMKSLMERTDVRIHTEEPEEENKSGFEKPKKRSNPRKKRSQLEPWRRHTLDPVALAALASREDFSRVSLRKTKGPGKEKDEYDGSLPVMLIQIKGRRQVQTRLVEPSLSSLNTGDCFILVTPKELFCWIGQHANTIEKAKAVEISSKIQKRRDMNCKTGDVLHIDETKQGNNLAYRKFCKILEGDVTFPIEDAKMCPDDEFYEREMISTNKVYKLQEGDPPHLISITELCGYMPRIGILNTKEVFVFDFGSELYVWTGQQSLSNKRKVAFHLAEMLYKQQFHCDGVVSPIDPRRPLKRSNSSKPAYHDSEGKELARPTWTLFAKLHEKAETLLFQEKFFDWPDPTKIIKMKGHISSGEVQERPPPIELKPCDPTEMQQPASNLEPVILEATNLGRGLGTPDVEVNGEVKEGDLVTTLGMTVWLVTQNKHFVLPKSSEGHFHSGDGYVIRWVYFVAKNRIVRDKRGRIRPLTGRQRCAYFFWQGNECSVNEKGAAAIMAVELDEEHGPQIRVVEGKEPPHFLKLFDGAMVIHSGKRIRVNEEDDEFSDRSTIRMYSTRNEDISEGCLVQVKRSASSLRSRTSFVVVDSETGCIFVWHGCKASEYHRKSAEKAANFIKERHPIEMNLSKETSITLIEVEEGQEPEVFWTTMSGDRNSYLSLLNDPQKYNFCPRLYHMTSATGPFTSTEILCPSRYPGRTCPFPFLQEDLYSASQPATFLLDVSDEVYVWEGWLPAEITKDKRGSAKRRWDEERKLTLQTALAYVKEASDRIKKGAYVVQAGLEPPTFTTHFPFWIPKPSIAEIKATEGKKDCEKKPVKKVLGNFTQKYYSFQELTNDSPPDGVDPSHLETYLTDEEFQKIFEMSRDLFSKLPGWKQDILKKALGLF